MKNPIQPACDLAAKISRQAPINTPLQGGADRPPSNPPTVSTVCPVCKSPAAMEERTDYDTDGPGSTTYAYMECSRCGIRSREGIGYRDFRKQLLREWTPVPPPAPLPLCGFALIWNPASDSLPDDEQTVLIALSDGEVWTGYHDAGQWRYVSSDLVDQGSGETVTHWANFPEPPPCPSAKSKR